MQRDECKGVSMDLRAVGISGSPVKKGNVDAFLQHMMKAASDKGLSVETLHLSEMDLQDCRHCNFCIRKQSPDRYCSLGDDGQRVFHTLEQADIIVLASPVYFMRTSGMMASLIDRLRVFVFGNVAGGRLKNKIGVSSAVAWARHGGLETAHLTHLYAFLTLEMIPVSVHHCVSPLGASAVSSPEGCGLFDKDIRLGVEHDRAGIHSAAAMMERAVELASLVRRGMENN